MNNEYRQYLIKNTNSIMQYNFQNLNPPPRISNEIINHPYLFNGIDDRNKPRGYEASIPKQMYLSHQSVESKKTIPLQKDY
jgi:hypothetical protein